MPEFEPIAWAHEQFYKAEMEHSSRNTRAMLLAARMVVRPDASIPAFCGSNNNEVDGAYRFFANNHITHGGVLSGHIRHTSECCGGRKR
jgi:hypothetical protein